MHSPLGRREASSDPFRDDRGGETVCSSHTKRSALSAEFDEGTSYTCCQDPTATRRSRGLNSHRGLPACRRSGRDREAPLSEAGGGAGRSQ
jgi:hypothetical protein